MLALALAICLRSAAKGRISKSRLVLKNEPRAEKKDSADLIGKTGIACTALRPSGIAEIDGTRINVVTEGDFIQSGETIRITKAEGNRIVVASAK